MGKYSTGRKEAGFDESAVKLERAFKSLSSIVEQYDKLPKKNNYDNINNLMYAFDLSKELCKDIQDANVTYRMHEPFHHCGSVNINAKRFDFTDSELFLKIVNLSDNFEVYPKVDGTINLNFGFNHLSEVAR